MQELQETTQSNFIPEMERDSKVAYGHARLLSKTKVGGTRAFSGCMVPSMVS